MSENEKEGEGNIQNQIFISYSHDDKEWLRRLKRMLKPAIRDDRFQLWDDSKIDAGDKFREKIRDALSQAKAAVLLVSDNFLASDFIYKNELPPLLEKEKSEGLKILWIAVSSSLYKKTPIAKYQALNNPARPLDTFNKGARGKELARICEQILSIVESPKEKRKQSSMTHKQTLNESPEPRKEIKKSSVGKNTFTAGKIRSKKCTILENKLFKNQKSIDPIKNIFYTLKDEICEIDRNVGEKISKSMVTFISNGNSIVWFHPLVTRLNIHLRKGKYFDKYNKIKEGWGGYPKLSVSSIDMDLDYLKDLFVQAYHM